MMACSSLWATMGLGIFFLYETFLLSPVHCTMYRFVPNEGVIGLLALSGAVVLALACEIHLCTLLLQDVWSLTLSLRTNCNFVLEKEMQRPAAVVGFQLLSLEETLFTIHVTGKWLKKFLSCGNRVQFGHWNFATKFTMLIIVIAAHLLNLVDTVSVVFLKPIAVWCLHQCYQICWGQKKLCLCEFCNQFAVPLRILRPRHILKFDSNVGWKIYNLVYITAKPNCFWC